MALAGDYLPRIGVLEIELHAEGYENKNWDDIDTPIAMTTKCPIDGTDRDYRGFIIPGRSYRAFSVCKGFGHAQEF